VPLAITAQDVRDAIAKSSGLVLQPSLTDVMLETWITDETAAVLLAKDLDALPGAGLQLDNVKGAVRDLVVIKVKRFIRGDSADLLQALVKERQAILDSLVPVQEDGIAPGSPFFEVL
jgi:hypothetical protein